MILFRTIPTASRFFYVSNKMRGCMRALQRPLRCVLWDADQSKTRRIELSAATSVSNISTLALQLWIPFEVSFLCGGLMSTAPQRPCDDVSGSDTSLLETLRYPADFLFRPTNEAGGAPAARSRVFFGGGLFA